MAIPKITSYPMPTHAEANRVNWQVSAQRAVLLVHDMQDYFLDFYDREREPIPALIANTRRLIDQAHALNIPVVYSAQSPRQTPAERGLLQDMWGPGLTGRPERARIVEALAPQPHDVVLDKWRYSAFQKSSLLALMHEQSRDQLIICGIYAHIGCMITACEAFMNDIQPFFVADALADFSPDEHAMALRYVSQRCGAVMLTGELIDQLASQLTSQPTSQLPASREELRALVAGLLRVSASELQDEDSLIDWGLDSIRIMSLLENWRRAGRELTFMTLAEQPTLAAWWALLETRARVEGGGTAK
jgi:bifunctional isochorismate lyase/aryl carrier protein